MTQLIESVLGGGGQMGERMRAVDWSTTALGPLEQWPQSLRICVQIILGSGYPMAIAWGLDYTLLYNDAQRCCLEQSTLRRWVVARGKCFPRCGSPSGH
jgi:hypothetical protein